MEWLRQLKRARLVRKARARGGPAEEAAIAIVIAGGAVEEDVRAAAREVTVVDTRAAVVADAGDGRNSSGFASF